MRQRVIHRWQFIGETPCGRKVEDVTTNTGHYLNHGVTCKKCLKATTYCSIVGEEWNGQSEGFPKADEVRITDEQVYK